MNGDRIEQMIKGYGEAMPSFQTRPRRRRIRPLALSMAATLVAVAFLFVFLLTPSAEARAYQRIVSALKDATTMEAVTYRRGVDGRYVVVGRTWIRGATVAGEAFMTSRLHRLYTLSSTDYVVNLMDMAISTRESSPEDPLHGQTTALAWVMAAYDFGVIGAEKHTRRLSAPPMGGRPVYALQSVKDEPGLSRSTQTIWVDSATNLPVRCAVLVFDSTAPKPPEDSYTDFKFNVKIPDEIFRPQFKPVIDIAVRQKELMERWQRQPAVQSNQVLVLDAQAALDGSLYVLYAGDWRPVSVRGQDGTRYVEGRQYTPGGVRGDTGTQKRLETFGSRIRGAVFVPVARKGKSATSYVVGFRKCSWLDHRSAESLAGPMKTLRVTARRCVDWPDYSADLVLCEFFLQVDIAKAQEQAKALEREGDVDGALVAYRKAYECRKAFTPSTA